MIHDVQVLQDIDPKTIPNHAIMEFRHYPRPIGVHQYIDSIFLLFQGPEKNSARWHGCLNDGETRSAFLLWGELQPHEERRITSRVNSNVNDQVYIECFRGEAACVLCLPVNARTYLEYDVVDANGVLQQTRLDPDKDPIEKKHREPTKASKKRKQVESMRYFLVRTTINPIPQAQRSCFFMSDGTFRYVPGAIRPMLD